MGGLGEVQTTAERIGYLEPDGPIVTEDHTFVAEEGVKANRECIKGVYRQKAKEQRGSSVITALEVQARQACFQPNSGTGYGYYQKLSNITVNEFEAAQSL